MSRRTVRWLAISTVLVLALTGTACSNNDEGGGATTGGATTGGATTGGATTGGAAGTVSVTLADFSVTPDPTSASAGEITFDIHNTASQTHEFVVFKTDLAPEDLPLNKDGDVDEEGKGVEHIDEVEDITGGSDAQLPVNLETGSYVLICNLPGHYQSGMHAGFTVS
jgi:uncharacterized cupredoxin-like copper-binding protein